MASLFFHSIAIINPSRFEGWSTTVEEAKSSGKTVLLSDIPVHREQDPPHGKYFSVDSASELADLMATTIANHNPLSEMENRSRAARRLPQRISQFAAAFENIVLDATASVRT
jgi:glycosyltransferase involved in cell wall biosynthesis